ncbi:hypothetical protein DUI70_2684 [Streptomyces albus]|nr:hypothetical protein DUI70_2684 [Streptomyces albus]
MPGLPRLIAGAALWRCRDAARTRGRVAFSVPFAAGGKRLPGPRRVAGSTAVRGVPGAGREGAAGNSGIHPSGMPDV